SELRGRAPIEPARHADDRPAVLAHGRRHRPGGPAARRRGTLADEKRAELEAVGQVALAEAARLLREAKEPFEPRALHRSRRAALGACEEVERAADPDRDGHAEAIAV